MQRQEQLKPEERHLIELIRESGWGSIKEIKFQHGEPTTIVVEKVVKLNK